MTDANIYSEEYPEGDFVNVAVDGDWIEIEGYSPLDESHGNVRLTKDEAIAAARAILKHYNLGVEE